MRLALITILAAAVAAVVVLGNQGNAHGPTREFFVASPKPVTRPEELLARLPDRIDATFALVHKRLVPDRWYYDVLPPCASGRITDFVRDAGPPVMTMGIRGRTRIVLAVMELGAQQGPALSRAIGAAGPLCPLVRAPPMWPRSSSNYQGYADRMTGPLDHPGMAAFHVEYQQLQVSRDRPPTATFVVYAVSGRWLVMLSSVGPSNDAQEFDDLAAATFARVNARFGTSFSPRLADTREAESPRLVHVNWSVVARRALACATSTGEPWDVLEPRVIEHDVTGDGLADVLVQAACPSSTSTPPVQVAVFDGASKAQSPKLLGVLGSKDYFRTEAVELHGKIITLAGTAIRPGGQLCCPDEQLTVTYRSSGSGFVEIQRHSSTL